MLYPSTCVGLRYGHVWLTRGFSRQLGLNHFWALGPAITPQAPRADFPAQLITLQAWHRNPLTGWPTLLRHPFAQSPRRGTGLLTRCPSPTARALGLGPTNPTRIDLPSETLDLRRTRFSRVFRYSCLHSHFCPLQPSFRSTFTAGRTLPYRPRISGDP